MTKQLTAITSSWLEGQTSVKSLVNLKPKHFDLILPAVFREQIQARQLESIDPEGDEMRKISEAHQARALQICRKYLESGRKANSVHILDVYESSFKKTLQFNCTEPILTKMSTLVVKVC